MKTKEVIFYEATGRQFHRFAFGPAILDAMQLYSDQQNKELREKLQRLTERNKYLEEHSNERFEQANELNDKDQEIQRLTKEVELLKRESDIAFKKVNDKKAEITRLRELVTQYLDNSTSDNAYGADVRTRILNELSPKP